MGSGAKAQPRTDFQARKWENLNQFKYTYNIQASLPYFQRLGSLITAEEQFRKADFMLGKRT